MQKQRATQAEPASQKTRAAASRVTHAFRHGRVSILQANEVPGDLVKEWVGHSNMQTTSLYTRFQDDFSKQAANEVALFPQENLAHRLQFSPSSPKSAQVAAEVSAA
ncbi:MAG: hypothetical protein DMG88_23645 [Acidobacteria bacterium]|nr:MAG: hypothetical protein DMG88_23645 [Acidobacteriota bacterium]